MAINFLNSIDFNQNELLHPVIENQANDGAAGTSVNGQLYFNTSNNALKVSDGSGGWKEIGGNDFLTSLSFNTTDGVLTATVSNQSNVTVDLDGRYALSSSVPTNIVESITAGTYLTNAGTAANVILNHDSTSRTDTTSSDSPGYGGTFEAVTSVTTNVTGHVTAIDISTVTIPASSNTDNYVDSVSFNTATGVLTLGRTGALADLTEDLDGRYLELSGGTMTGSIAMDSNSITGLVDPTNAQDAATKAYVDNLVDGGLTFKDGFNANTGAIDGGGNLTSGTSRVAIEVGDYYVVTTAGDFYGDSSIPLTVGDSVICKTDAAQGASTSSNWVIVQGDEGVVDLTSGNGSTSTGNALTSNTTARGSVTINSFAYGGTTNVGHVPSGGSATTFLRGDGTWVTPSGTAPNDATITLTAGTNITGGGDFTTDQSANETITFNVPDSSASTKGAVIVAGGTGINVSYASGTATVSHDGTNQSAKRVSLNNTVNGVTRGESGGITTFTIDVSNANIFGGSTSALDVMVEVIGNAVNAGDTVYAETGRSASNLTVKFTGSVANGDYQVLLNNVA